MKTDLDYIRNYLDTYTHLQRLEHILKQRGYIASRIIAGLSVRADPGMERAARPHFVHTSAGTQGSKGPVFLPTEEATRAVPRDSARPDQRPQPGSAS